MKRLAPVFLCWPGNVHPECRGHKSLFPAFHCGTPVNFAQIPMIFTAEIAKSAEI
jgi:hypothetical protein